MRICLLLIPALAMAQEAPAGTDICIRLLTGVSSRSSKLADPVEAVVIAPVVTNGRAVVAPGAQIRGTVEKVAQPSAAAGRAALLLHFTELETGGARRGIDARVAGVDNARETVDEKGQINGILASETLSGELDAGLDQLSDEYGGFASILSAAKNGLFEQAFTDIAYKRGVEMTLRLAKPLTAPLAAVPQPPAWPAAGEVMLAGLIGREPFQTVAQSPPNPSDLINLLLVATEDGLRRAFTDAGWSGAAALDPLSKFETLRALVEDRGYSEAPVSVLLLDGKLPDLVFEKTNDTFARRHHLRIWRRPGKVYGKAIWAVAATHDIGIDFSEAERTFIHRIDPRIDSEREKVVADLLFAGHVDAFALGQRPAVPRQTRNATGDRIETDSRIAVLLLH